MPLVLNTSYNEQEPLVLTPDDALATFFKIPIDALFLNDRLVLRARAKSCKRKTTKYTKYTKKGKEFDSKNLEDNALMLHLSPFSCISCISWFFSNVYHSSTSSDRL